MGLTTPPHMTCCDHTEPLPTCVRVPPNVTCRLSDRLSVSHRRSIVGGQEEDAHYMGRLLGWDFTWTPTVPVCSGTYLNHHFTPHTTQCEYSVPPLVTFPPHFYRVSLQAEPFPKPFLSNNRH